MAKWNLKTAVLALLGATAVGALAGVASAQDCNTFNLVGAFERGVSQSGSNANGYGLYSANTAYVGIDKIAMPDDCERGLAQTHFAVDEIYWVLFTDPGCAWNVTYKCDAVGTTDVETDVDDWGDCDDASGSASVTVTPGGASVSSSASDDGSDSDYATLSTTAQTKTCLANGSDQVDFIVTASASGTVVSQAKVSSLATYDTFNVTVMSRTLCP